MTSSNQGDGIAILPTRKRPTPSWGRATKLVRRRPGQDSTWGGIRQLSQIEFMNRRASIEGLINGQICRSCPDKQPPTCNRNKGKLRVPSCPNVLPTGRHCRHYPCCSLQNALQGNLEYSPMGKGGPYSLYSITGLRYGA